MATFLEKNSTYEQDIVKVFTSPEGRRVYQFMLEILSDATLDPDQKNVPGMRSLLQKIRHTVERHLNQGIPAQQARIHK